MNAGIIELDLHGKNKYQARISIDYALRHSMGVYRIRLIHGYNSGTELRDMIFEEYSVRPEVIRLERAGDGATVLVLREL